MWVLNPGSQHRIARPHLQMNSSFPFIILLLSLLIAAVFCNHHKDENDHHKDDKWISFVSQIESFWKTDASIIPSEGPTESSFDNKDIYTSGKTPEADNPYFAEETPLLNGSTDVVDMKEKFKMGMAALISIPIVSLVVLICCCYCICKCCCNMCAPEESNVIVMNSNVTNLPPERNVQAPTQIIVQQPIYQHVPPPHQEMSQYPPPHQQWGPPQFQQPLPPQYYPTGGIDNPNFYHGTAPPQYASDKY